MNELLLSGGKVSVNRWQQVAASGGPEARTGHTVTTLMDNLYIHGGTITSTGLTTGELWCFNVTNKTWTQLLSSPTPAYLHATVGIDGRLFSWGGLGSGTIMRIYNAATNTWSVGATVPAALNAQEAGCLIAKWNTTIYILGGRAAGGLATDAFIKYESATNTWTTTALAVHPTTVGNGNLTLANGYFYSYGGNLGNGSVQNSQLCRYDPGTNTWTVMKTGLAQRAHTSAVFLDNNIIYFGGSTTEKPVMYNPFTDTLGVLDDTTPLPLHGRGMLLGNKLYRFGANVNDNSLWVYDHYIGRAKPSYVYINGAEFVSGTTHSKTATGGTASIPTTGNDACDFILVRSALGVPTLIPCRSIIMNKEAQYFLDGMVNGGNYPYAGCVWKVRMMKSDRQSKKEWDIYFGTIMDRVSSPSVTPVVKFRQEVVLNNPHAADWGTDIVQTNTYNTRAFANDIYGTGSLFWLSKGAYRLIFELVSGTLPW